MKRYQLVIFDLDGTLMDTSPGLLAAFRGTLLGNGLPAGDDAALRAAIGPPFHQYLRTMYPAMPEAEILRINEEFRNLYAKDSYLFNAAPYPGIFRLWELLRGRGITLAVATNKRQDYAVRLLEHFGFDQYTTYLYGTDAENKMRKSDVICRCLHESGVDGRDAVMVGDTVNDAAGAKSAGVAFVGVCYGFGFRTEEAVMRCENAVASAYEPMDLMTIIGWE